MEKFVFISHKSDDKKIIKPYLDWLGENNIKYWWDNEILEKWSPEIDGKLKDCAAVIGFFSEKAYQSDPVLTECVIGNESEKLIAVKLDSSAIPYSFRQLIISHNYVDLTNHSPEKIDEEKRRLFRKIQLHLGNSVEITSHVDQEQLTDISSWINSPKLLPHLPYLVSLSFFEGRHHDFIQRSASILEGKLVEAQLGSVLKLNSTLVTKRDKLSCIRAEAQIFHSSSSQSAIESIRFQDQAFAHQVRTYIWAELDQLKAPMILWIEELIEKIPESIEDIATCLSSIGLTHFESIFSIFLNRWLHSRSKRKFLCADITLSFLVRDRKLKYLIREKLFAVSAIENLTDTDDISASHTTNTVPSLSTYAETAPSREKRRYIANDIAIDLVTGFTGMAMPDLSIHVFKAVESEIVSNDALATPDFAETFGKIKFGLRRMLIRSKADSYAKIMLKDFTSGLSNWAVSSSEEKRSNVPNLIFVLLLQEISVGVKSAANQISLASLLLENNFTTNERTLESGIANSFSIAIAKTLELKMTPLRDLLKSVIKDWGVALTIKSKPEGLNKGAAEGLQNDKFAFDKLFQLVLKHASTPDDKERVRSLVKSVTELKT